MPAVYNSVPTGHVWLTWECAWVSIPRGLGQGDTRVHKGSPPRGLRRHQRGPAAGKDLLLERPSGVLYPSAAGPCPGPGPSGDEPAVLPSLTAPFSPTVDGGLQRAAGQQLFLLPRASPPPAGREELCAPSGCHVSGLSGFLGWPWWSSLVTLQPPHPLWLPSCPSWYPIPACGGRRD